MKQIFTFIFMLSLASFVSAAVPAVITHQGYLANSSGVPLSDSTQMIFSLYTVETGGTAIWTETQTAQVNNGIYAVALGSVTPFDTAQIDGDLWLGVTVGTDSEMTPRQKLDSVAYSIKAGGLADGTQLNAVCELFDNQKTRRPDFCPQLSTKKVFISSQKYNGSLGGLAGADQICQDLATSSGIGGVFKAWLGDSTSDPSNRFVHSPNPYVRLDGKWIADDWQDLTDGFLHLDINIDQTGSEIATPKEQVKVWTGTNFDGLAWIGSGECGAGFTSNSSLQFGVAGSSSGEGHSGLGVAMNWTNNSSIACNYPAHLYCFEQ